MNKDDIEAGADLCDAEIAAAEKHIKELLKRKGKLFGCTSYMQRSMGIGYNHAARIMDYLEACGFISEADSVGERRLRK